MKRRNETQRNGVVLLLILGLMAMFAISVLTYMIVTSNMAETAQNSAKIDAVLDVPAQEDVVTALKTVTMGSNNERNPIGPFSILENMYGDWKEFRNNADGSVYEDTDVSFQAQIALFPNLGYAIVTPVETTDGSDLMSGFDKVQLQQVFSSFFENSGGVMTFNESWGIDDNDALNLWNSEVAGSSAFILEKVITNPTGPIYKNKVSGDGEYWLDHYLDDLTENASNQGAYWACDYWHFKVELTEDLKRFASDYEDLKRTVISEFNRNAPRVTVRLNRAPYSGTGAGGFTPGNTKDAQVSPDMVDAVADSFGADNANQLRIPFAFWANAAAPDLVNYKRTPTSNWSARTYWAHLTDVNYDPAQRDGDGNLWYLNNPVTAGYQSGAYLEPVRMNPSYTAPDFRTLFLAHYDGPVSLGLGGDLPAITPSFHRPSMFQTLVNNGYLTGYAGLYTSVVGADASVPLVTSLIRKLTPRPLPSDHWNFSGSNPYLNRLNLDLTAEPFDLAERLANSAQWDVDNDGDGVREGVWIPSGLPIRVDKNGTPYATMFSYTVLDLDGRVNVNTAGNWDQLPNNLGTWSRTDATGATYDDNLQPYNYVDELASINPGTVDFASPFYNADLLNGSFNWNDDWNNTTDVAVRGDGRGASGVLLYEALASIFANSSTYEINTMAANLIWRRNLTLRDDPNGVVDMSGLAWTTNAMFDSQPGGMLNGNEVDDKLGTSSESFIYMNPLRLLKNSSVYDSSLSDADSATLGEAKMIYPWRGKTTIGMGTRANLAPAFDFANTAFRSYDPLGAQIYTYAPRYSKNPYLAYQNVLTWQDNPYSLPTLERLLRPFDGDVSALPSQLVDDLHMNTDLNGDVRAELDRATARQSLTTISSDVPAPSLVFPNNNEIKEGEYRGGHFGFADLIRSCVRKELYKAFERKGLCQPQVDDADEDIEGTNVYLETGNNALVFDKRVEEITAYLVSMLPPEIMAGEKIDLNALSQKNYWLDVDYDGNGNAFNSNDSDRSIHNLGLVKRMERARGLYIVMMTLLYEDMNALNLYGNAPAPDEGIPDADEDGADGGTEISGETGVLLENYLEGSFDLLKYKGKSQERGLVAEELTATRIAQWCVNTIDFADPDATMTPFFFDPTPFDGWWVYDDNWIDYKTSEGYNPWKIRDTYKPDPESEMEYSIPGWNDEIGEPINFLFSSNNGVPAEQMEAFFIDALNNSENSTDPNSVYVGPAVKYDDTTGAAINKSSNEYIAEWMTKKINKLEDQTGDMGFRLVWGMERPDLLLTETMSFHDLGIADTDKEKDSTSGSGSGAGAGPGGSHSERGTVAEGKDETFDQVKRPVGSTYLELYCTANPNVPQSRELYDYDTTKGVWRLELSRKTPIYTDSEGRELTMPIWRVAISASSDPRGLCAMKSTDGLGGKEKTDAESHNKTLNKSNKVVYRKAYNSVLNWLSPTKKVDEKDKYLDDFNFFSMQPRQFRNLPTPPGPLGVDSIADLDIDQGLVDEDSSKVKELDESKYLADWKKYNISASNVLGPAVAAKDDDPRTREVELDRIVWFTNALGDSNNDSGKKLGTAGEYPDALRTFCNVSPYRLFLEPNQYLVVGPEQKRAIGSVAFNSIDGDQKHFGVNPPTTATSNWVDISNLRVPNFAGNYQYMVAAANIGGRGLNISEPLWTSAGVDPYWRDGEQSKEIKPTGSVDDDENVVLDIPFEMPKAWGEGGRPDVSDSFYEKTVENYPIVQDELFGVGTVPGYKSAFVQRVADPNRPYHPLMNPYITVDWNMMDLTIFTGECVEVGGGETELETPFTKGTNYKFSDNNKIKLAKNVPFGLYEKDKTLELKDAFSSRQWGNGSQKMFAPTYDPSYAPKTRPNPWARAFQADGDKAGLQAPNEINLDSMGSTNVPVVKWSPKHTLGMYNGRGDQGSWNAVADDDYEWSSGSGSAYRNLNPNYMTGGGVYMGSPRVPFEHLVWNDAPYSNPMELALVPASAPGRFGLEFIRKSGEFKLDELYKVDRKKKSSLGSFGVYGFEDWYNKDNVTKDQDGSATSSDDPEWKKLRGKAGAMGPYLNFFVSSKTPGETLNLCKALEFVYTPSMFLGTKKVAGRDSNGNLIMDNHGNTEFRSVRREPGKININTAMKAAWQAVSPNSERVQEADRLPGSSWDEFQNARYPYLTVNTGDVDDEGNPVYDTEDDKSFCYFQPAHTLGLWAQMDKSPAPIPTYTTLLAQQDCDLADNSSVEEEPLFDNIGQRYVEDGGGNVMYSYKDPTTNTTVETSDVSTIPEDVSYTEVKTSRRNNLFEATAEMQRLSGLTTNRSNVFATWVTVGYFEVERCNPGKNMPNVDPDGNTFTLADLIDPNYKWYQYYQAIYPDGYTYGKELGSEFGETKRHRGFAVIDRSIPVDYRRGNSVNYKNSILLDRILD